MWEQQQQQQQQYTYPPMNSKNAVVDVVFVLTCPLFMRTWYSTAVADSPVLGTYNMYCLEFDWLSGMPPKRDWLQFLPSKDYKSSPELQSWNRKGSRHGSPRWQDRPPKPLGSGKIPQEIYTYHRRDNIIVPAWYTRSSCWVLLCLPSDSSSVQLDELQRWSLKKFLKKEVPGNKGNLCTRFIYIYIFYVKRSYY